MEISRLHARNNLAHAQNLVNKYKTRLAKASKEMSVAEAKIDAQVEAINKCDEKIVDKPKYVVKIETPAQPAQPESIVCQTKWRIYVKAWKFYLKFVILAKTICANLELYFANIYPVFLSQGSTTFKSKLAELYIFLVAKFKILCRTKYMNDPCRCNYPKSMYKLNTFSRVKHMNECAVSFLLLYLGWQYKRLISILLLRDGSVLLCLQDITDINTLAVTPL